MDGHICLVQLVFLLNVLYAQSPANGGGKLYLGHVDNEDFISDLQLSKSCCILSAYFLCGRSAAVSFLHRHLQRMEQFLFMKASKALDGSSIRQISGLRSNILAIPILWRSPPESLALICPYRYHIHLARYG